MTTPKVAPKVGDRVRVVLEGEVTFAPTGGKWIDIDNGATVHHGRVHVEILPPPVRVGDVATREVCDSVPDGSVVAGKSGVTAQAFTQMSERRWFFPGDTGAYESVTVARLREAKVIFIPDPT